KISEMTTTIENLMQQLRESALKYNELQELSAKELSDIKSQYQKEIHDKDSEISALQKKILHLNSKLERAIAQHDANNQGKEELQKNLKELQAQIQKMEALNNKLIPEN